MHWKIVAIRIRGGLRISRQQFCSSYSATTPAAVFFVLYACSFFLASQNPEWLEVEDRLRSPDFVQTSWAPDNSWGLVWKTWYLEAMQKHSRCYCCYPRTFVTCTKSVSVASPRTLLRHCWLYRIDLLHSTFNTDWEVPQIRSLHPQKTSAQIPLNIDFTYFATFQRAKHLGFLSRCARQLSTLLRLKKMAKKTPTEAHFPTESKNWMVFMMVIIMCRHKRTCCHYMSRHM